MESLYLRQSEQGTSIERILINFKKESRERKTIESCQKRFDLLESYWREYEINHEKLRPYETSNHNYFVNSEFERVKDVYKSAERLISESYDELLLKGKQQTATFSKLGESYQQHEEAGPSAEGRQRQAKEPATPLVARRSNSKLDDMLRKQSVNFKAFVRAVESMEIESFREKWEFEDALRTLQTRWTAVDNSHWEIMTEIEEDEAYEFNYTKHEGIYSSMKKAISSKMWSTSHRDKSTPQIDIPVFTGNFNQWVSFKDLFDEAIHNNPSLSNAQKMQFLKCKVKGEAERLIQHLPINADNYSSCWEILNHRFNNKKQIFTSHVSLFLNIPNIQQQSFTAIKRLHDVTRESLYAIEKLGVDISTWDPLLVHLLSQKLDNESYSEYIASLKNSRELPLLQEFLNFLEIKFTTLESSRRRQDVVSKPQSSQQQNHKTTPFHQNRRNNFKTNDWKNNSKHEVMKSMHVSASKCPNCLAEHSLQFCKKFLESSNENKLKLLNQLNYCINCIYDHNGFKCHSAKRCRKCDENHHTILHDCFDTQQKVNESSGIVKRKIDKIQNKRKDQVSSNNNGVYVSQRDTSQVLLQTALVKVTAADNTQHVLRALIDQGSQVSLISEKAAQHLGLRREQCHGTIFGIGEQENRCKGKLAITCQSTYTDYKFNTNVLIMNNLIQYLPGKTFEKPASWDHIAHIFLADPDYNISRPVDLILGADVYSIIILEGIIRGQVQSEPLAQHTKLGWLLCGSVNTSYQCNVVLNNIEEIQQFWKIEDIHEQNEMSVEDEECLDFYKATTTRLETGRYVVRLPLKQEMKEKLGSSKEIAIAQFKNLERKFSKQESLAKQYKQFISEYEQLKHMKASTSSSNHKSETECFLPHHAVQRADSSTTKLRVVFNASAKTTSGYSINDLMYKGPNLQQDLQEIILKWRQYRYAYTADIEKCYRMILVHEKDQKLQQIVWRESPNLPIKTFQLATITYGTKSAPFLALMTLRQLAEDEQKNFPYASKSIRESFYMDDWVSGAHSIAEGKKFIAEVNACLSSGGFTLRKWSSNNQELLEKLERSENKDKALFTFKTESSAKTSTPEFKPNERIEKYVTTEESKKQANVVQNSGPPVSSIIDELLNHHSSFIKITHILAWILRALTSISKQKPKYLTLHELRTAKLIIIKHIQRSEFTQDIDNLLHSNSLKADSKLLNLNPKVDQEGILRVGGRLQNANISADMKYPIIIPYSGRLTELLIEQAHELTFHGGARLTSSCLRQKYWIVKGNRAVKKQLLRCVTCKKQEPRKLQQIMGDIPDYRTNPAPTFYHTGVDFTGFVPVKANKGRGIKTSKGYIALFICMVTKAVHLELVSDLSSASFIAALRRMAARRGAPKHMYSDNGTNFVGANKILEEEYQQLEQVFNDSFHREVTEMNIEWHWNCPSWPSAGGIWERSIRSLKQHLKRVVGEQVLTFEEYSTVLAQIEGSLNSRPLCPISDDIDDLDFLTPAHFLTNRAGLTVIETAHDARTRWQLVNKIFQDLWKRWKTEYLSQLSVRSKWLKAKRNIEIGDMVTIHDDNMLAGKFPVGRVVEVHKGKDDLVRVATLKTKNGYIKRPIVKLSILPIERERKSIAVAQQKNEAKAEAENIQQAKPSSKQWTTSRTKLGKFVSVALSLIFFMSIVCFSEASYNITQFNANQSLYFESIGKMHLIRDQWKIVAYYNMQPYWQGDRAVNAFTKYLEQTCAKVKEPSHCHMILLQIQHDYSELQYYNQLLLNQHFGARSRTRRGLINAIGSVANTLFGVLDESFAEKYKRDIELVNSNQQHLTQLWRNQTSVVEAEYNILKRTEQTIEVQHKLINKHLNYLDQMTQRVQKGCDGASILQEFALAAIATNNMVQNLKRIQDTLIDTMTDIYHGKLNLHLITPKQLSEELQIVSGQISKELTLPIDSIQSNLYQIYKLLKIKARMSKEYFIFEISLPLISRDNFQLYHLIPVPTQVEDNMISVKTVAEYVAINLRRDSYLTASMNDLKSCEYYEQTYLCQLQGPIEHLYPEERFCDTIKSGSCDFIKQSCKNRWIQLHDSSTYFYYVCNSYSLRIICDEEIQARQVSKAGLIQLSKQCMLKGRDLTLYSYQQENTLTLKPDIFIQSIAPLRHPLVNITFPNFDTREDSAQINTSLKDLGDQITSMKEAAQQDVTLSSHDIHHYAISYVLLAAAVAAFLWFLWRRGRRAVSSPAPTLQQRDEQPTSVSVSVSARNLPEPASEQSVSARKQPLLEQGDSVHVAKRWSSLRYKRDKSTSPIKQRQSVFTIDKE